MSGMQTALHRTTLRRTALRRAALRRNALCRAFRRRPAVERHSPGPTSSRERGAALIIALLLLTIVSLLATSAWQVGMQEERIVGHQRDRNLAFEAAEAALRDGESDVLGICASGHAGCTPRPDLINGETGFGDNGAQGSCSSDGLCLPNRDERPDFTSTAALGALRAPPATAASVPFGHYTRTGEDAGRAFKGPNGDPLPRQPRYVIEVMCYHGGGQGMTSSFVASCPNPIYRITAIGWGLRQGDGGEATEVVLQSYYSLGN